MIDKIMAGALGQLERHLRDGGHFHVDGGKQPMWASIGWSKHYGFHISTNAGLHFHQEFNDAWAMWQEKEREVMVAVAASALGVGNDVGE